MTDSTRELRGVVRPVSVAPMMQRTDRHFRVLLRQLSRETLLYTEMVTTGAILHGDRARHLGFDPIEHPIALQLGGDDPKALTESALIAVDWGYDEVNLNVGCPSDRVQSGRFGACLMAHPERVAEAVSMMRAKVDIPVTVKHRIGIDDLDRYEDMLNFVNVVSEAQADRFSVHARKAWLSGLSPKENRNIPPLRYEDVFRLKRERPDLIIELNGGIRSLDEMAQHLTKVDAVMIGRAAYDDPTLFSRVDSTFFGVADPGLSPVEVVESMIEYIDRVTRSEGCRIHHVTRHMLTLFRGKPGGRHWRRRLSDASKPVSDLSVVRDALSAVTDVQHYR